MKINSISVADLKEKASKARDAGVSKFSSTRGRYTSVSSAKAGIDTTKKPPPPPPVRPSSSASTVRSDLRPPTRVTSGLRDSANDGVAPPATPPVAPPRRSTSDVLHQKPASETSASDSIQWSRLTAEDKQIFFSWLDEFFAEFLGTSVTPPSARDQDEKARYTPPPMADTPPSQPPRGPVSLILP